LSFNFIDLQASFIQLDYKRTELKKSFKMPKNEEEEEEEKEELKSIFDPFYQAFSTQEIIITCTACFTDKKTRHEYFFRFQIKSTQYKV
jgi:hypothetical protein